MIIEGGASAFVAGLGVPTEVVDLCHQPRRARRQHVRQGRPRRARRRGRLRPRRGPGHRGGRPHRAGRHRSRSSPRSSTRSATASPSWRPGASSTAAASPRRWRSAPTASGSAPASSPRPRPAASSGYKDTLLASREDQTTVSRAYSGKTMRVVRNDVHRLLRQPSRGAEEVPRAAGHLLRRRRHAPRRRLLQRGRRRRPGVLPGGPGRRAPSPSSSPRASSSVASWPRPRPSSTASPACAEPSGAAPSGSVTDAVATQPMTTGPAEPGWLWSPAPTTGSAPPRPRRWPRRAPPSCAPTSATSSSAASTTPSLPAAYRATRMARADNVAESIRAAGGRAAAVEADLSDAVERPGAVRRRRSRSWGR